MRSTDENIPLVYVSQDANVHSEGTHPVGKGRAEGTTFFWNMQIYFIFSTKKVAYMKTKQ